VVANGANTAEALNQYRSFPIGSSLNKALKTSEFYNVKPGLGNVILIIQVYGNLSVSFDSGYRFNGYLL
jgi:hypothetical protein